MFEIREEASLEGYLASWECCMGSAPWFNSDSLFWYDREEELEELRSSFGSENVFLVADRAGGSEPLGVLAAVMRKDSGHVLPWHPGVIPDRRCEGVGEALITEVSKCVKARGAEKVTFTLKYSCDSPESGAWLDNLYRGCGFVQTRPKGLQMLADLTRIEPLGSSVNSELEITGRENLDIDDLVAYTLRAFASDPEDRADFGWDPLTTTWEGARKFFDRTISGEKWRSPPQFFRVAWLGGEPVGFAGSLSMRSDDTRGIVGPVGVFPEHRRRGIGTAVVLSSLDILREHGFKYAYLGTSVDNKRAIGLYEKIGFDAVFHTVFFEKDLSSS